MLNLNAMFGSCESIFETNVSRKNEYKVSPTELQMMEMEISADLARSEVDNAKISATTMQLDQLLNMYNHAKQYGIDRTFLSLYNSNNQLNNMIGVKFPSCESINTVGDVNSNMSRAFIVAMEDEKEGIFTKIWEFIKKIIKKIVDFFKNVWTKIKEWANFKIKNAEKKVEEIKSTNIPNTAGGKIKKFVKKHPMATIATTAAILLGITYKTYSMLHDRKVGNSFETEINDEFKKATDNLSIVKGMKLEEALVKGKELKDETETCLKELKDSEKTSEILEKVKHQLSLIDDFFSNNTNFEKLHPVVRDHLDKGYDGRVIKEHSDYLSRASALNTYDAINRNHNGELDKLSRGAIRRIADLMKPLTEAYRTQISKECAMIDMLHKLSVAKNELNKEYTSDKS
jgi:ElaB/YqjD/DUF883 family membrane-anchored ribosome-binding protein